MCSCRRQCKSVVAGGSLPLASVSQYVLSALEVRHEGERAGGGIWNNGSRIFSLHVPMGGRGEGVGKQEACAYF